MFSTNIIWHLQHFINSSHKYSTTLSNIYNTTSSTNKTCSYTLKAPHDNTNAQIYHNAGKSNTSKLILNVFSE